MGKYDIKKSFCSANCVNSGETAEQLCKSVHIVYWHVITGGKHRWLVKEEKLTTKEFISPPPFQYQCKVWNLSAIIEFNSNNQNVFILIEFFCQTQTFKFLMWNFPWQVMIARISFTDCAACFLQIESYFKPRYLVFSYTISHPTQNSMQRTNSCF